MPHNHGADLGGIRTLADLRSRCYVDADTKCWHWRGATLKRKGGGQEPRVWMADARKSETLPRAAWQLSGKNAPAGRWTCWRTCRSESCGNPAHLMAGTKAEWGAWVKGLGYLRGDPVRSITNRRNQKNALLTMELAQWARESPQTGAEVAHALGVSDTTVSRVRLGQTYSMRAASVFNMALFRQPEQKRAALELEAA